MKKITILALLILATFGFNSCEDDDKFEFIAQAPEEFNFSNSFLSEYVLVPTASGNIGERFTWNGADFDVQTVVSYDLQKSISGDFSDMEVIGTTTENELAVTIGDLLGYARDAGLDNDPVTAEPNTGDVSFRIRAFVGDSGPEVLTAIQILTLVLPEDTGNNNPVCDLDQLWAVGSAMPDAGWGWTTPNKFLCSGDGVYSGNVYLIPDDPTTFPDNVEAFRFFTTEGDWASGLNYPYYEGEGYTIDPLFRNADDGDKNFEFLGTAGNYFLTVDTVNKTITLDVQQVTGICDLDQLWVVGSATPDAGWGWTTPIQVICNGEGIYATHVNLIPDDPSTFPDNVEAFRFFTTEGDWASGLNYPYYEGEGYTIDPLFRNADDGDKNFEFLGTAGNYLLTIDTVAKTITLK